MDLLLLCGICMICGGLTAISTLILYSTFCKSRKNKKAINYYTDFKGARFFITGDKHRDFKKVKQFCRNLKTRKNDVLIILGDSSLNYYEDDRDDKLKSELSKLNITLFCLHGNKENRPQNISTYGIRSFCGGKVYFEPKYPNIYFAIDGEIYTFEGRKYMVVGGAHSVDKLWRIERNEPFWDDEMPSEDTKHLVEQRLEQENNKIYGMLTHTCPIKYLPTEMFLSTRQRTKSNTVKQKTKNPPKKVHKQRKFTPDIDRSTEEWLGVLEDKIQYSVWFCGHYHIDKQIDELIMMCSEIRPLHI